MDETQIVDDRFFRVWLFNRNENSTRYEYDNYSDSDTTITYDIQGAESVDITEQELKDLRTGLQRNCGTFSKAILVRDLRKQENGEYIKTVHDLIRIGKGIRELTRLEEERRQRQAEARRKKATKTLLEKKKQQLAKLKRELEELET